MKTDTGSWENIRKWDYKDNKIDISGVAEPALK